MCPVVLEIILITCFLCNILYIKISEMFFLLFAELFPDLPDIPFGESEFNEFNEPRLKSAKNRVQFSAGLNLEKLNTILSGTSHLKFGLRNVLIISL